LRDLRVPKLLDENRSGRRLCTHQLDESYLVRLKREPHQRGSRFHTLAVEAELSDHPHHRVLRDVAAKSGRNEGENVDLPAERAVAIADQVCFVECVRALVPMENAEHTSLEVSRRVEESCHRRCARSKQDAVLSNSIVVRPDREGTREPLLLDGEQYVAEWRGTQGALRQWLWDRRRQSLMLQGTIRVPHGTRQ
jgi:hypothetical protein